MKLLRKAGSTSQIFQIFVADSSSTTGAGLTGLTSASGGLTAYYHRDTDTTATVISLTTMTVGTFTSSGFKEIDATNMPGWYQFCPPNAAFASGAASVAFHLKGATNMAPLPIEVDLGGQVDVDTIKGNPVVNGGTVTFPTNATLASTTNITTAAVTLADGVTHGGTTAMLRLGSSTTTPALYVTNTRVLGSPAVKFEAVGGAGIGLFCTGGGAGGNFTCSTDGPGISSSGSGAGSGFLMQGGATGHGWQIIAGSTSGNVVDMNLTSGRYITQAAEDEIGTRVWLSGTRTVSSAVNITSTGTTTFTQTGDSFARIGALGAGLTSLAPSATALSTAVWTPSLATALGTLSSHDPGATLASRTNITAATGVDVTKMNGTTLTGDGSTLTPWGPA